MNEDSREQGKMEVSKPQIIQINEGEVHAHVDRLVKQTVEEMLNGMLDAEADRLCQARRYERNAQRQDTRAGHYKRKLHVKAGEVELKVPKLRHLPFETAIIERYRRREASVEEALIEMYLAGVSVRRVEDITEALWGTRVSPGTVSNLNKKTYERINQWRNQPIEGRHRYIYLDGIWLKRSWCGEVRNLSILVCIGVGDGGFREVLGVVEGAKEDRQAAEEKIQAVAAKLEQMKLAKAATMVREGAQETLSYYNFPQAHWRHLRTNNPLERIMREIRRRTRVVGSFPDGESALMLVAARLRYVEGTRWGTRRYMSMERFNDVMEEEVPTTA